MLQDVLLKQVGLTEREFLTFVLLFARLEYALKRTHGFVRGTETRPEADWTEFGRELSPIFKPDRTKELTEAVAYLDQRPPLKQVLRNGTLDFDKARPRTEETELVQRLDSIRIVRNNLFHGGKYPAGFQVDDPARNADLLLYGSRILEECLALCRETNNERLQNVYSMFHGGLD